MNPRLTDAWAKLERAKRYVDALRVGVGRFADGQSHPIEVRREYEPERSAIVYTVWPGLPNGAGLLIGDAVNNFRAALNYLAWQLAIDVLGREPDETEARDIQFPILNKSKAHSWPSHPHRRFMSAPAADAAKNFQPFQVEAQHGPDMYGALRILSDLSNHDKHRTIQVAALAGASIRIAIPNESESRDCRFRNGSQTFLCIPEAKPMRDGDELALVYVVATGPNPDVDLKSDLSAQAVLGTPNWDLMPSLDAIGSACAEILSALDPCLK